MKLIDEKGRLFGKINVIDFLVILFLISLTPMVYYGYKIFNAPPLLQELITVKVKFSGLIPEIVALINKGDYEGILKPKRVEDEQKHDTIFEIEEEIIAKVKNNPIIESLRILTILHGWDEYRWLPYPSNNKDVTLTLQILCTQKDDGLLYYKNNPVKVGASFSFQTKEYDINGTIVGISVST